MLKSTVSIVAFTLTFGFSVVLVGILFGFPQANQDFHKKDAVRNFDQTSYEIERLVSQDVRNGELRNSRIDRIKLSADDKESITHYSTMVNNYLRLSSVMDDSFVPKEFQDAWREHMAAWENYSDFLNRQKHSKVKMSEHEFNEMDQKLDMEISRTWIATLRIGKSFGADF